MNITPLYDTSKPYTIIDFKAYWLLYVQYNQVKHSKIPSPAYRLDFSDWRVSQNK
jgi:hypothetical protein